MDEGDGWSPRSPMEEVDVTETNVAESDSEESSSSSEFSSSEEEEEDETQLLAEFNEMGPEAGGIVSLLAINQAYLDLIERLLLKVQNLLEKNREEQKKINQTLRNPGLNDNISNLIIKRTMFFPPYIKDTHGMVPVANEESKQIRQVCSYNLLMRKERQWLPKELADLRSAVAEQLKEQQTRDLISRQNLFRQKMENYSAQDGIANYNKWRDELATIQRRLNYIRNLDDKSVFKSATYNEIDWRHISFNCQRTWLQLKMKWMNEQAPHWNRGPWTAEEDEQLKTYGQNLQPNWDVVATRLATSRTPYLCFERFLSLQKAIFIKKPWTSDEDEKLVSLVQTFTTENNINWRRVAAHMSDRTRDQCEVRYSRSLDARLNHGRWVESEDLLLLSAVNKYGPQDWVRIANMVPGRNSVQCRARWIDSLDQKRNNFPWTPDEDEALLIAVSVFGRNNFSAIAKMIPGRNTSSVKCRVRLFLRWKIIAALHNQEIRRPEASQLTEMFKERRDAAFKRFNNVMRLSATQNQNSVALSHRLGYGSYIVGNEGKTSDYSRVRRDLAKDFGKWMITRKGKWIERFFNQRAKKLEEFARARQNGEPAVPRVIDEEQANRIGELMERVLKIERSDIDAYKAGISRRNKTRQPKPPKIREVRSPKKRRISLRKKLAANFSALISEIATQRYTVSDRLTDEICHRVTQLPQNERRNFIVRSMCEHLMRQIEYNTNRELSNQLRPVLEVKTYNYLRDNLGEDMFVNTSNSSVGPSTSSQVPTETISLDVSRILSNLIFPSNATVNMLVHYRETLRLSLWSGANKLFAEEENEKSNKTPAICFKFPLSKTITSSTEYLQLKQRMLRLFLIPMLMQKSLEQKSVLEERQTTRRQNIDLERQKIEFLNSSASAQDDQTFGLDDKIATNNETVRSLNALNEFKVYNPLISNKPEVIEVVPVSNPRKRPASTRKFKSDHPLGSIGKAVQLHYESASVIPESRTAILVPSRSTANTFVSLQNPTIPFFNYQPRALNISQRVVGSDKEKLTLREFILQNRKQNKRPKK
ncbi:hypothetical protein M3Y98_01083800 [Aphelenchoides besseyi]|nr:hypothetical protein M3Y98_01083800 [Aphelenchoides besseyi]